MEAFGIFEGGGAKGLAHVGALKAVESRVEFVGVSGSSAGAIVAALVSVGYSADDLFLPGDVPSGLLSINYPEQLLGSCDWALWKEFERDFKHTFLGASPKSAWIKAPWFRWKHRKIIEKLSSKHGVFETTKLCNWVNSILHARLVQLNLIDSSIQTVLFKHIQRPLKIVATNVESQGVVVYGTDETPEKSVAKAVAASASLPFFFVPIEDGGKLLLDGGLISNFPAWNFDKERRAKGPLTPTLGFRLVSELPNDSAFSGSFLGKLIFTVLQGDELLEVREVENLHSIPLKVTVGTTAFDMSPADKNALYEQGRASAVEFLRDVYGPKDPDDMREILEFAREQMLEMIGRPKSTHMRVNIVWKTTKNTLRVTYSCMMEDDPDDQLEFELDGGACGECWRRQDIIFCDLVEARGTYNADWKMSKYQQALVRRDLKSLLCVPIFVSPRIGAADSDSEPRLVGVLNFDSTEDLKAEFENEDLHIFFAQIANIVSECLEDADAYQESLQ